MTVHVPRRPYARMLPGHPDDPGVRGARLRHAAGFGAVGRLRKPVHRRRGLSCRARRRRDAAASCERCGTMRRCARRLAARGRATVAARHTCAHRVDELLGICSRLATRPSRAADGAARMTPLTIAFFGSSLVSAYWNGAATYYRGHLARRSPPTGTASPSTSPTPTTGRQHRDIDPTRTGRASSSIRRRTRPAASARSTEARGRRRGRQGERRRRLRRAAGGVRAGASGGRGRCAVFWDVDAPATLAGCAPTATTRSAPLIPDSTWS